MTLATQRVCVRHGARFNERKRYMKKLTRENATSLIVDFQEKIVPAMSNPTQLIDRTRFLLAGLATLAIPIISTRQYPKGLGNTLSAISEFTPDETVFDKTSFSCLETPSIRNHILQSSKPIILLAGIETHICILQTALDLLEAGKSVHLVVDCTSSRTVLDHDIALQRLASSGVVLTTAETALFELTRVAGTSEFKAISKLTTGRA